jgi:hypothetical protein
VGYLKRRIIESMEPKEEPPMGHMKDLDIRIRNGGDDAIAAACELMPRWISVEDRLPNPGADVLIYYGTVGLDGEMLVAHCHVDGKVEWADDVGLRIRSEGVTHWMPLPEPPEVKP